MSEQQPIGLLEQYARVKDSKNELNAASLARMLSESYGDEFSSVSIEEVVSRSKPENLALPTPDGIIDEVCVYFGVERANVIAQKGEKKNAYERHLAIFLISDILKHLAQADIKRVFNRDHSTIHHAISKVRRLIEEDEVTRTEVEEIRQRLELKHPLLNPNLRSGFSERVARQRRFLAP